MRSSVARSERASVRAPVAAARGVDLESRADRAAARERPSTPSPAVAVPRPAVRADRRCAARARSSRSPAPASPPSPACRRFRDAQTGLWAQFDPLELATPAAFARNPKLVWDWYAWRRELLADIAPERRPPARSPSIERPVPEFLLATQNVDGLHASARAATRIVELHGNLQRASLLARAARRRRPGTTPPAASPPRCADCGAPLRPGRRLVRGEHAADDVARRGRARSASTATCCWSSAPRPRSIRRRCCPPTRSTHGATVVEVNPRETRLTPRVDVRCADPPPPSLPALVRAAFG